MTPYEEVADRLKEKTRKALVTYGQHRTTPDNTAGVEKAAEQSLNFFEALLTHHKPKPPFENKKLSEIAPNKRKFFSAEEYAITTDGSGNSWMSGYVVLAKGVPPCRVLFSTRCVILGKLKEEVPVDNQHYEMIVLVVEQKDKTFWHVDQMKKPIPHELKRIRSNARFYGLHMAGLEDPMTDGHYLHKEGVGTAYMVTEAVNEALRIFSSEVRVHFEDNNVTLYDRWFAVRLPRIK